MAQRQMYKTQRLDTFLGIQISPEVDEELEREAARLNVTKGSLARQIIADGLEFRRLKELRAFAEFVREAEATRSRRAELLTYVLTMGLAAWRKHLRRKPRGAPAHSALAHPPLKSSASLAGAKRGA